MTGENYHEIPLNYGKIEPFNVPDLPKGKYFSTMPEGLYFCIGINTEHKVGLIDIHDGKKPVFEGRINIEEILENSDLTHSIETQDKAYNKIMDAYQKMWDYQSGKNQTPSDLEVMTNSIN